MGRKSSSTTPSFGLAGMVISPDSFIPSSPSLPASEAPKLSRMMMLGSTSSTRSRLDLDQIPPPEAIMNSVLKSMVSVALTSSSVSGTAMPSPTNMRMWALCSAVARMISAASNSRNMMRWPPRLTKVSSVNRPAPCMSGAEMTTFNPPSGEMFSATSAGLCRLSP